MKKILLICCLAILVCGCQSKEDKAINCILSSIGENQKSAKENGVYFEDTRVAPAYSDNALNDSACMVLAEMILMREEGFGLSSNYRMSLSQSDLKKPWKDLHQALISIDSVPNFQVGWEVYTTACQKMGFGNINKQEMRFVLDKSMKKIIVATEAGWRLENIESVFKDAKNENYWD